MNNAVGKSIKQVYPVVRPLNTCFTYNLKLTYNPQNDTTISSAFGLTNSSTLNYADQKGSYSKTSHLSYFK